MIPSIKRVFKQLKEFYSQDKNPPENWDNKQYALFGEFILLLSATLITCILHFFKMVALSDINCLIIVVWWTYYCNFIVGHVQFFLSFFNHNGNKPDKCFVQTVP